jgi:hypothetical protein
VIELAPQHAPALEILGTTLVTRRRSYREGLDCLERAVAAASDDAGTWYALGWCYEFVAHEIARRRPAGVDLDPRVLYERAAEGFRFCLDLRPGGKLQGDAEDLLDHVENELAAL